MANSLQMANTGARASRGAGLEPVAAGERILALDVLRGFALFGVLLAYTLWNLGSPPASTYGDLDRLLNWILAAMVDTKFYTLFAFLFGLGFAIQLSRAESRGRNVAPAYRRRLLTLLAIGLVHATLLRNGDILVPYAVMGFLLLPLRHASNKTLVWAAIVGLLFPYLIRGLWSLAGLPFPPRPEGVAGNYFAENIAWVRFWYSSAIFSWPAVLPMFLFGLYMGRRGFFEHLSEHRSVLRRTLLVGLIVGITAFVFREVLLITATDVGSPFVQRLIFGLLWSFHAWALAAFYATFLILMLQRRDWQRWLMPLGAVGRMSLTNYLLQATLIVPICIGFDLFDRVTPTLGLALALLIWLIQVPASEWWLRRFRFGPAEWLWRSLTYGRLQPMRVAPSPALEAGS